MITVKIEDREGAPAYVASAPGAPEIWSYASHFVENEVPRNIIQGWADHFEVALGRECMAEVIAAVAKIKAHPLLDDVTRQQIKDVIKEGPEAPTKEIAS